MLNYLNVGHEEPDEQIDSLPVLKVDTSYNIRLADDSSNAIFIFSAFKF